MAVPTLHPTRVHDESFAGQIFWNRFTGPGRVGIQSMYFHPPVATESNAGGAATTAGIVGGILGSVLGRD